MLQPPYTGLGHRIALAVVLSAVTAFWVAWISFYLHDRVFVPWQRRRHYRALRRQQVHLYELP
jgi:hypothetical protein